jgi:heme exporter protein D
MMDHGTNFGMHGGVWMWLFWGLLLVVLVLLIVWLVKQIRK